MRFKNLRPVGKVETVSLLTEPGRAGTSVSGTTVDLTIVGDACAAEVELSELSAAQ